MVMILLIQMIHKEYSDNIEHIYNIDSKENDNIMDLDLVYKKVYPPKELVENFRKRIIL